MFPVGLALEREIAFLKREIEFLKREIEREILFRRFNLHSKFAFLSLLSHHRILPSFNYAKYR